MTFLTPLTALSPGKLSCCNPWGQLNRLSQLRGAKLTPNLLPPQTHRAMKLNFGKVTKTIGLRKMTQNDSDL